MKDRICITGASGFIGSYAARYFIRKGFTVAGVSRKGTVPSSLSDMKEKILWYAHDLSVSDFSAVLRDFKPSVLLHFAASGVNVHADDHNVMAYTNAADTARLMDAIKASSVKLAIHAGSSSEYGTHIEPMHETSELRPINQYGIDKAAASLYCQKLFLKDRIPVHTFRLFSPYGYGEDRSRFIPSVIADAIAGKPIRVSNPVYVRDFIFIDDVMGAYELAIRKKTLEYPIYNLGSGEEVSLGNVVSEILCLTKSTSEVVWNAVKKQDRQVEPAHWQADISRIRRELHWHPKTNLSTGLRIYIDWMRSRIDHDHERV